ncbi:MAG: M20/M25/M40 family metallo-hydrolase, partial [Candidatus Zixiibacteriota bacterium]
MRYILTILCLTAFLTGIAGADELYQVRLKSHSEASTLKASGAEPLVWVDGDYLILTDAATGERLRQAGIDIKLITSGISRNELALDGRFDDKNVKRYPVLFEKQGVRLLRVGPEVLAAEGVPEGLFPIFNHQLEIEYYETRPLTEISVTTCPSLDALVKEVSLDSLYNYVCSLQAYPYRYAGTENNLGARNWIYRKFEEFGYTDVELDDFYRYFTYGANVIAYKPGTAYPDRQVLITGHYDAVLNSPGADDNASGVACMLEIARILKDVDLPVTLIFIAFDAEEKGLIGAYHYVDEAVARGDDISFVQNMDMIAASGNDLYANLHHGPEIAYVLLWRQLAQIYSGIDGQLAGTSNRSDHYAFQLAGFDVGFAREYVWSDVYHTMADSTTHMNFDYMTRMVKACLATVHTAGRAPGEVVPAALWQPGDGTSLLLHWHPANWPNIKKYHVGYFPTESSYDVQYACVHAPDTCIRIEGLIEGQEYGLFVVGEDEDGYRSVPYFRCLYRTPLSIPVPPTNLLAMPVLDGINLTWDKNNTELDLHHYDIFRDGEYAAMSFDTFYTDLDPSLGVDYHTYYVTAVDTEDKSSAPSNTSESRAATLEANSILAINRSGNHTIDFVSAYETEVFLLEAMEGFNYTYYCDTTATKYPFDLPQLDLVDMIDYGVLVIGAESGKWDEICVDPDRNGILDTIAYYLSIGGKVVMFGRWGDLNEVPDTIDYTTT